MTAAQAFRAVWRPVVLEYRWTLARRAIGRMHRVMLGRRP